MPNKSGGRSLLREFLRRRQHPVKIIGYTSKTLWLLVIPIAKNIVASNFDIQGWLRTYWLEFITILVIVGWAVFRWLFVFYRIYGDRITVHAGPFGLIRTTVYFGEITALRTEQGYLYRAVKACTLYIETQAVSLTNNEIKLVISKKSTDEIFKVVSGRSEGEPAFTVAPRRRHMLVFSLIFSSTLSGIIVFGAVTFQMYRIVGGELERQVANKVNSGLTEIDSHLLGLSKTVPQAVLFVGAVIAGGWLISFVSSLLENWSFRATRRGGQLLVESGAVKSVRKVIERHSISCFDLHQTLLMKFTRICSVHILCAGYSKSKRQTAALIPIATYGEMAASMRLLAPELGKHRTVIYPARGALRRYTIVPLIMSTLPIVLGTIAKQFSDRWHSEINIFMLAVTVPIVWKTVVAGFASKLTSFGITKDTLTVSYCKGYQFHRVVVPRGNITEMTVVQNFFQRKNGTCTLLVCTDSETVKQHRVYGLPYKETAECLAAEFTGMAEALLCNAQCTIHNAQL